MWPAHAFRGGGWRLFCRGSVAVFREDAAARLLTRRAATRAASAPRPSEWCTKWPTKSAALKARVEAVQGRKPKRKGGHALEGLKARLDAVKVKPVPDRRTGWQGRRAAPRIDDEARQGERTVSSPDDRGEVPARWRYKARAATRLDRAPKIPAPRERLARLEISPRPQRVRCKFLKRASERRLSLRPRPRHEAMPISGGPHGLATKAFEFAQAILDPAAICFFPGDGGKPRGAS